MSAAVQAFRDLLLSQARAIATVERRPQLAAPAASVPIADAQRRKRALARR
jgi:hypothetical protein